MLAFAAAVLENLIGSSFAVAVVLHLQFSTCPSGFPLHDFHAMSRSFNTAQTYLLQARRNCVAGLKRAAARLASMILFCCAPSKWSA
jgi:hypothetical protein